MTTSPSDTDLDRAAGEERDWVHGAAVKSCYAVAICREAEHPSMHGPAGISSPRDDAVSPQYSQNSTWCTFLQHNRADSVQFGAASSGTYKFTSYIMDIEQVVGHLCAEALLRVHRKQSKSYFTE